jgi:hypothetical protein
MNRFAFMSPEWLEMAGRLLQSALDTAAAGARHDILIEERFHNPPANVRGVQNLTIRIRDGAVSLHHGPADTAADVVIDCEWDDAHLAAALRGAALDAFTHWRIAQGRLSVRGEMSSIGAILAEAHDRLAAFTLPFGGRHPFHEGERP